MGLCNGNRTSETSSLMREFLRQAVGFTVLDGALATELECHSADLNDPLWSAKCILTPPHLILKVSTKPIVIYPNSRESYDAEQKEWVQNTRVLDDDFASYVSKWCEVGASLVGGCCRTTPNTTKALYRTLFDRSTVVLPP